VLAVVVEEQLELELLVLAVQAVEVMLEHQEVVMDLQLVQIQVAVVVELLKALQADHLVEEMVVQV
jgi:hypothetical protein